MDKPDKKTPLVNQPSAQVKGGLDALQPEAEPASLVNQAGLDQDVGDGEALVGDLEGGGERPWRPWVDLAKTIIKAKVTGWEFPEFETNLCFDGIEKQLHQLMPNGLVDLEKYPAIMIAAGAGLLVLHNADQVEEEGRIRFRIRSLVKPAKPAAKPLATKADPQPAQEPSATVTVTAP